MKTESGSLSLPVKSDLEDIYQQLQPYTVTTPLLEIETLSQLTGGCIFVKPESLQKTGAFKFRGALYRLKSLSKQQQKQGVAAYSSGNFAQGLAAAGQLLGIPVTLVMPHDAPANKIHNAARYGASLKLCHDSLPSREEAASQMATELARERQQLLLHPFDDPLIINGQASVAIELECQLKSRDINCQQILCPVGGGSLVAGASLVFKPPVQVVAVEASGYEGMNLSLIKGELCRAAGNNASDCDALQALEPGKANLKIALKTGVTGRVVSEKYIRKAIQLAWQELKLVLEPSGAIALAAIMETPDAFSQQTVVAIATGGNVDKEKFIELLGH